jgi:uncharacterized protein (DUF885 family)
MRRSLLVLGLVACGPAPAPVPAPAPPSSIPQPARARPDDLGPALEQARAGVRNASLADLLTEHWAFVLEEDPLRATKLGVHKYDDRLTDVSEAGIVRRRAARRVFRDRAGALTELSEADAVTRDLFLEELNGSIASEPCEFHRWTVDPRQNPVTEFNYLPELHKLGDEQSGRDLVQRYKAIAPIIDDQIAALRSGAKEGWFGNRESIARVVAMLDKQLAAPLAGWKLVEPADKAPESWSPEAKAAFAQGLRAIVGDRVRPALERYRLLLVDEILPKARGPKQTGLGALSMGKTCYAARIRSFTTLDLDAAAIHQIGIEEIAKTDREMAELGKRALTTTSLAETLAKLRSDEALHFDTAEAVERAANELLAAAKAKMGGYFGRLPQADCVVRRVPDYEAPYTTIAYYRPPHTDGSKPGEYFVNVLDPKTRPRYQARVLAVHEAIPGHHLQIAISQELPAVPAFRKHGGFTAFIEGWGLYSERLAEEMGLYQDDLDRIGVASFDAWRAGRLVVDTGLHAMGWSRDQAKRYLREHTALNDANIDNEVDRYINWPGQALAYKLGQRTIWRLRRDAEARLGDAFELPAFHDQVLGAGAVTLPVLERRIDAWVAAHQKKVTSTPSK